MSVKNEAQYVTIFFQNYDYFFCTYNIYYYLQLFIVLNFFNTYNELDQLTCVLCKTMVRSETLWPVHLNSKAHKDNMALTKRSKLEPAATQPLSSTKRASATIFQEPQPAKKVKGILKNTGERSASIKSSLPAGFFDESSLSHKNNNNNATTAESTMVNGSHINGSKDSMNIEASEVKNNKESGQAALPEGFFDDPVKDAKVIFSIYQILVS